MYSAKLITIFNKNIKKLNVNIYKLYCAKKKTLIGLISF